MVSATVSYAKALRRGGLAAFVLIAAYFVVVGLISGLDFAFDQFRRYWYFMSALALGFGIQVGMYAYLKDFVGQHDASGKVVAATGTTSTVSMVSCCAHYLVNVVPVLGVAGFLSVVAEYQIELFWLGLAFNVAGISYIATKMVNAAKEHRKC